MKTHDILYRDSTARRLRDARAAAADWNARTGRAVTWRDVPRRRVDRITAHGPNLGELEPRRGSVCVPWETVDAWRFAGTADTIAPRTVRHFGWYCDSSEYRVYRGAVWQLPARDGSPCYVAGYVEAEGRNDDGHDSGYVVMDARRGALRLFASALDAALAADSLAERDAERDREYDERYRAAFDADVDREESRNALRAAHADARQAVAALREQRATGAPVAAGVCAILRDAVQRARSEAAEAVQRIRDCTDRITELGMNGEF